METASRCLRTFTLSHHAALRKILCLGLGLWLCSTVCPTALVLASPSEDEDDDFVVICTNRAVLDVGLLSLIRPIASRSVIQLLSNHCHFNNPIFSAYFFYLARGRGPNCNASRLFSLFYIYSNEVYRDCILILCLILC